MPFPRSVEQRLTRAAWARAGRESSWLERWLAKRTPLPKAGDRRIEIGSGFSPRPGYLHVDQTPGLPDLDLVSAGHELPVPPGWADELLAVHMIEHVPAGMLNVVLETWRRQLRPGGKLVLHTPNGSALAAAFLKGDPRLRWPVQAAIFGYDRAPWDATTAVSVGLHSDHKLMLSFDILRDELLAAGYEDVTDVSGQDAACHHTRDWADWVPGLCLEVSATAPARPAP